MNKELRKETFPGFFEKVDVDKRSWVDFLRPLFTKLGFISKFVFRVSNLSLGIYDRFAAKIFRPFSKYFIFNTVYRRRLVSLVGLVIIVSSVYLQTLTQIKPPLMPQITNLPYQEKITEGAWALKNREPIQQVLVEGAKADLNLKEVKNQNSKVSDAKGGIEIDYDMLKYRWYVTLTSGTKFEFGGIDSNTPDGKVKPEVKITNKEGWFVSYSPKYKILNTKYQFVTPRVKGNIVEWEISDGIIARYTMMQDRVKADYIINHKSSLKSNKLEFNVSSGQEDSKLSVIKDQQLTGELMPGGDIEWFYELNDSGGQTASQFTFPAPIVTDSSKNTKGSRVDSGYEFKKTATGKYLLAIVLDEKDLKKATFPLTIDPVVIDGGATAIGTAYGNGRKILRDAWGNLIAVIAEQGGVNSDAVWYKKYNEITWNDAGIDLDGTADAFNTSEAVAADIDSSQNIHVVFQHVNSGGNPNITYVKLTVARNADNTISGITRDTSKNLSAYTGTGTIRRPSLIIANKGGGTGVEKVAVAWAANTTASTIRNEIRFMQRDVAKENYKNTVLATSGLSGYWRLGESSGTNANDESTTANDGTYRASPTLGVAGAIDEDSDTAATFAAGSLQYVDAPDNNAYDFGTGDFSLEVWVKKAAPPASTAEFILGHNGDGGATDWELYWRATVDGFQSRISGATACNSGTGADVSDSKWHHVAVTMDRNGLCTWYIDGQVSGTPTDISGGVATDLTNTSLLYIGRRNAGSYFDGSLDEVAIYKGVVLTADQVAQHYDAGTYAWKNASEEISGVGACANAVTSGAAGLPNTAICKGASDAIRDYTTGYTTHHGVLTQFPNSPKRNPGSVKKDINGTFSDLNNLEDGNSGTTDNINSLTTTDYLYVGDLKPFSKISIDIDTTNSNAATFSTRQYCSVNTDVDTTCDTWTAVVEFADNTSTGTITLLDSGDSGLKGSFLFNEPSDWVQSTENGAKEYWVRFRPSAALDSTVSLADLFLNDRNSSALVVITGIDANDQLGSSVTYWDEIGNAGWENIPSVAGNGWDIGPSDIGGNFGGNWGTYTNFPLTATIDYKNNRLYVAYVVDSTTLTVKSAPMNMRINSVGNSWANASFPTVTVGTDIVLSFTSDGNDIYLFYVLDPGTNSLVFRRCTGSGGGLGGICDNASDWGSEKTLDNGTDNTHPQAVVTKVTGDTVAIDTIFTTTTTPAVEHERHYVDLMDNAVVVAASADDAFHRDCVSGTDDQDITAVTVKLGREAADASCVSSDSENHIGLRFPNITVAQGAAISSAYIDLRVTTRTGSTPIDFSVYGEDVDNAVSAGAGWSLLTDCTDPCTNVVNTVTKTTSTSSQSINFVTNTYRIDVTDIVQEIVCRGASNSQPCVGDFNGSGTWASGNAMAILMISTEGGASGNSVAFVSQDDTGTTMLDPTLQINLGSTGKNYSLGSATQLATGSASIAVADLDHPFSSVEFGAVATDDTNYASVSATTNYASQSAQPAFMFKVNNSNNDNTYKIDAQTIVKSTVPTTSKPVYLQVYRGGTTDNWVTMASNNNTAAGNDITLTSPTIDTNTSEYYFNETPGIGTRYAECTNSTANCWTYWRVYQDNPTTTFNDVLSVDYVNIVLTANGPDKIAFSNAARTLTAAACNGAASVFTMEIQKGTTPTNPLATTVVRVTSNSSSYTIYSDDTCSTSVTNGDFTYTTAQNTKSVYIIDNKKSITTRTLTGTRQSGDTLTTGTQNYTVNAGAVSKLVITLPGETFTDGTGNSGTVTSQRSGTRFPIQINATDANFNVNTSYTGDKVLVFSGPGVGTSTPTVLDKNIAEVNYGTNTTITFSSGTAANIGTTLYKGETTTITATDGGSYGNASASLTIDVPDTKIRGGTTIRGGSKIQ